jgi:hypothetical protein
LLQRSCVPCSRHCARSTPSSTPNIISLARSRKVTEREMTTSSTTLRAEISCRCTCTYSTLDSLLASASTTWMPARRSIWGVAAVQYVRQTVEAIDRVLNNIQFQLGDELKLRALEPGFLTVSKGLFPGTVAADDGVVFCIQRPPKATVSGDVSSFFTRKGYYAYGMQAFVDESCRFGSISMKICSSHITAQRMQCLTSRRRLERKSLHCGLTSC